ncbi:MAG: hypothetical protein NTZ05_01010 [Chloroflexi bacterium]|nr:hypothetical protein [Chloroflexota bacterium]
MVKVVGQVDRVGLLGVAGVVSRMGQSPGLQERPPSSLAAQLVRRRAKP